MAAMNIRQAARWAERKGCLSRWNSYTNEPEYMYAVYDTDTHLVECIGSYEKCDTFRKSLGQKHNFMRASDGRCLRMEALETIVEQMDESEGEARCIPDACEVREWS